MVFIKNQYIDDLYQYKKEFLKLYQTPEVSDSGESGYMWLIFFLVVLVLAFLLEKIVFLIYKQTWRIKKKEYSLSLDRKKNTHL